MTPALGLAHPASWKSCLGWDSDALKDNTAETQHHSHGHRAWGRNVVSSRGNKHQGGWKMLTLLCLHLCALVFTASSYAWCVCVYTKVTKCFCLYNYTHGTQNVSKVFSLTNFESRVLWQ